MRAISAPSPPPTRPIRETEAITNNDEGEIPTWIGQVDRVVAHVDVGMLRGGQRCQPGEWVSRQEAPGGGVIPPRPQVEQAGGGVPVLAGVAIRLPAARAQRHAKRTETVALHHLAQRVNQVPHTAQAVWALGGCYSVVNVLIPTGKMSLHLSHYKPSV